jgi:dipeptidyl aminopeptidase/acylaminoacyl peptidase
MHAQLVKPLNYEPGKRYPLIVTTYTDAGASFFLRGGVGDEYPMQVFAAQGFAVLNFEAGGETKIALPPAAEDFKTAMLQWESPLAGLKSAIEILDQRGIVDAARVAITGLSYGASIAAFSISHSNLFHAAAMSQGGSLDLMSEYFVNDTSRRNALLSWGLVDRDGRPILDHWRKLSAALNVDGIHCPVLLNESDSEYLTSLEFYAALRDHHKPVEVWLYPNEYHEKVQPKHRYSIYQRNLDWMKFWLQGYEDPDEKKVEQYRRWEKLCDVQRAEAPDRPTFCVPSKTS